MASPFKRVCLRASGSRIICSQQAAQRHTTRQFSITPSRAAINDLQTDVNNDALDSALDALAKQPGVKYSVTEIDEDLKKIDTDNLSSLAHRELEQHRELREMTRLAAWEMPMLSQFAKPFSPPTEDQVLRWRYTTYLGEAHPAARKVVVEFQPENLKDLTEQQREKLLKVAGQRYNPSTKTIKMSCESFESQAQNKRYLADTISKLIAECKDPKADSFADIPLDIRHHKPRVQHKFPEAWALTAERKAELEQRRKMKMIEEGQRVEQNRLVNGLVAIEAAREVDVDKVEEPIMAEARRALPKGKMGKKEMGQLPGRR